MPTPSTTVLGLGPMGSPIARNLLRAGVPTTVWNRTVSRTAPFQEAGARVAQDMADTAAPVVLSVLPDVSHLEDLLDERTLEAWGEEGTIVVVMSTTSPEALTRLEAHLNSRGVRVVEAPMSGGVTGAEAGTLSMMIGGAPTDVAAVRPVLSVIGGSLEHFGALGGGALAKLCNQVVVAGTLTSLAEALGIARAGGLDPAQLITVLDAGLARSEVLTQKRSKLLEREYSLGGSAVNQLKDLRYADTEMERLGVPGELLPTLRKVFEAVVAEGRGEEDHAVVQEQFARR